MLERQTMLNGVGVIQVLQACSTFSFATIYSSLTLFIVHQLGFEQTTANNIFGAFLALNYVLHLLGGMISGKYISNRNLFFVTIILKSIGIGLLATASVDYLYAGLSFFLIACGINATCIKSMLTDCFEADDNRRERAFFINYATMNAGFFSVL